jgi:acetyl-CoA synthetase
MARLTDYTTYADAQRHATPEALWALFDGDRRRFNITHECVGRWASTGRVAVRVAHADGRDETIGFAELAAAAARVAHWLAARGVAPGERVAIMLEPSLAFYAALFGALARGAVAVPLFTLFGPEGVRLRVDDCAPRLLLASPGSAPAARAARPGLPVVIADAAWLAGLGAWPERYEPATAPDDPAVFQYTSGTTRELPAAVRHPHRALVPLMIAALYGTGIRPGDRFFCPSSPAWGHGLWHGTLAPLALGVTTGAMAGRFDPARLLRALAEHEISTLSAAATHFRLLRTAGLEIPRLPALRKLSFTGEPMDAPTRAFVEARFGLPACSMYGTTEVGVVLADYPGAPDHVVRPGALGKPVPGVRVEVRRPDGSACAPGEPGEIGVWRRGSWVPTRDRGVMDADGYVHHAGRADDVIISAGWTMSPLEIEQVLLAHPDVREAAVIGVADPVRGQVAKAFVVSDRPGDPGFAGELQELVRTRLARHEYPRQVAFVPELPTTPAGKVNRKALREREAARAAARGPEAGRDG